MRLRFDFIPRGLLFDLDGTLLDEEKKIRPAIKKLLNQLRESGIKVGVATGRSYPWIMDTILPEFAAEDLHLISGGGQIIRTDGTIVWEKVIPSEVVKTIFTEMDQVGAEINFSQASTAYCNTDQLIEFDREMIAQGQKRPIRSQPDQSLKNWQTAAIVVEGFGNPAVQEKFDQLALGLSRQIDLKRMKSSTQLGKYYYDVTAQNINKATGARRWAKLSHLKLSQLIAFGDNANDVEILTEAGWGVAIANGTAAAKAAANEIINDVSAATAGLHDYLAAILRFSQALGKSDQRQKNIRAWQAKLKRTKTIEQTLKSKIWAKLTADQKQSIHQFHVDHDDAYLFVNLPAVQPQWQAYKVQLVRTYAQFFSPTRLTELLYRDLDRDFSEAEKFAILT